MRTARQCILTCHINLDTCEYFTRTLRITDLTTAAALQLGFDVMLAGNLTDKMLQPVDPCDERQSPLTLRMKGDYLNPPL